MGKTSIHTDSTDLQLGASHRDPLPRVRDGLGMVAARGGTLVGGSHHHLLHLFATAATKYVHINVDIFHLGISDMVQTESPLNLG